MVGVAENGYTAARTCLLLLPREGFIAHSFHEGDGPPPKFSVLLRQTNDKQSETMGDKLQTTLQSTRRATK
jgi:hypothetical protein